MNKCTFKTTGILIGAVILTIMSQVAHAQKWPQSEQAYQQQSQSPQWIERTPQHAPTGQGHQGVPQYAPGQSYQRAPAYGQRYAPPTYYAPNPAPYYIPQMNMVQPPVFNQGPFNSQNYAPNYQRGNSWGNSSPWGGNNSPWNSGYPSMPNMNNMNMPNMDMPTMDFDVPNMNNMPFMGNGGNNYYPNMPFMN